MKKYFLLIIILSSFWEILCKKFEFIAEDGVLVLDSSNYGNARQIPNLAVFYYNSNRDSKKLLPVLYQLVDQLKSFRPIIYVGKVDGDNDTAIIDKEKVTRFPSLKVFTSDGRELAYDGMNSIDSLVSFIKRKVKLPIGTSYSLAKFQDIENFIAKNKIVVIYFGKSDTNEFKSFARLSESKKGDYMFGHCFNAEVRNLNHYDLDWDETPQVIIFNDFKGKNVTFFGEWSEKRLSQFIRDHTSKNFLKLSPEKWSYLINERNDSFLLLLINDMKEHDVELEEFQRLGKNLTNKIVAAYITLKSKENKEISREILEFVGVKPQQIPTIALVDRLHEKIKVNLMDLQGEDVDFVAGMRLFEKWAEENDLFQEKKKEELEFFYWENILNLNESNFNDIVFDDQKDVVVIFWNKETKGLKEIKSKFIEYKKLFINEENVVFCEMNLDKNKIEGIELEANEEKILFYSTKRKGKPVEYISNIRNEKKFAAFIQKYSQANQSQKEEL